MTTRLARLFSGIESEPKIVYVPEGQGGWQNLSVSESLCFVYAKPHPHKKGHKVSAPIGLLPKEGEIYLPIKHIGEFQTTPITLFSRVWENLRVQAQWIP